MPEKDEHRRRAPNFQQSCSILTFPIDNSYCNISPVEVSVVRTVFAQKRSVRHKSAFRTGNHCWQKFCHYSGGASGGGSACCRSGPTAQSLVIASWNKILTQPMPSMTLKRCRQKLSRLFGPGCFKHPYLISARAPSTRVNVRYTGYFAGKQHCDVIIFNFKRMDALASLRRVNADGAVWPYHIASLSDRWLV